MYRDVAEAIKAAFESPTSKRTIKSLRFRLKVFSDLEPWLEREVLGERFKGRARRMPGRGRGRRLLEEKVPRWHGDSYS